MEKKKTIDLMLGKLNKEIDLTWGEISKESGLNFSDSHVRKMAYGVKLYDELLEENNMSNGTNNIDDIKEKIIELKKTRIKLSDERTLANKKIRALARIEDFIETFKDELELLAYEKPLLVEKSKKSVLNNIDKCGVLLLSDIHYGIECNSINNVYNPTVAKTRMDYLVSKVLEHCKTHNIKDLYVVELGDTISGNIHNNLRLENRIGAVQQVIGVSELISNALFELSKNLDSVVFTMTEGNHDRLFSGKDDNLNSDSFNILVEEMITQRTKGIKNLHIHKASGETYTKLRICGISCMGVHGHKDKPQTVVNDLDTLIGEKPKYVFMGHYHNANEYTTGTSEVIVNGSFVGSDEYAKNIRKNSPPVQKFIVMTPVGRECTYNINI